MSGVGGVRVQYFSGWGGQETSGATRGGEWQVISPFQGYSQNNSKGFDADHLTHAECDDELEERVYAARGRGGRFRPETG